MYSTDISLFPVGLIESCLEQWIQLWDIDARLVRQIQSIVIQFNFDQIFLDYNPIKFEMAPRSITSASINRHEPEIWTCEVLMRQCDNDSIHFHGMVLMNETGAWKFDSNLIEPHTHTHAKKKVQKNFELFLSWWSSRSDEWETRGRENTCNFGEKFVSESLKREKERKKEKERERE